MRVWPRETKVGVAQKQESCFPGLALNYRVISYNEVKGLARLDQSRYYDRRRRREWPRNRRMGTVSSPSVESDYCNCN